VTGYGVQHSLQFVGRRFRRARQDCVAVVNVRRDERMYECGRRRTDRQICYINKKTT